MKWEKIQKETYLSSGKVTQFILVSKMKLRNFMISNHNHMNDENVSVVKSIELDEICHTELQVRSFNGQERTTVVTENQLANTNVVSLCGNTTFYVC